MPLVVAHAAGDDHEVLAADNMRSVVYWTQTIVMLSDAIAEWRKLVALPMAAPDDISVAVDAAKKKVIPLVRLVLREGPHVNHQVVHMYEDEAKWWNSVWSTFDGFPWTTQAQSATYGAAIAAARGPGDLAAALTGARYTSANVRRRATAQGRAVPLDVAAFLWLIDTWQRTWSVAGRYGPAGLKVRQTLILLLSLIIVTFALDSVLHLSDHELTALAAVGGGFAAIQASKKD